MNTRWWVPIGLLAAVPVAPALRYGFGVEGPWIFLCGAIGIGVLADWIRRATEQLAGRVGSTIGGLLNVSFGSLAEVILAFFVLADGAAEVVRAQITGSILGTSLFGLGLAIVVGSIGRPAQHFNRAKAGQLASLLILAMIALLLPAVFDYTGRHLTAESNQAATDEWLSIGVAVILLLLYAANLVYTLVTHRDVFAPEEERQKERCPRRQSRPRAQSFHMTDREPDFLQNVRAELFDNRFSVNGEIAMGCAVLAGLYVVAFTMAADGHSLVLRLTESAMFGSLVSRTIGPPLDDTLAEHSLDALLARAGTWTTRRHEGASNVPGLTLAEARSIDRRG